MRRAVIFLLFCFVGLSQSANAQRSEILVPHIATLQVTANDDWRSLPIITLGGGDRVNISFDDLTHAYQRYTYRVEHCEADWTVSQNLFQSDFLEGFAEGLTLDDYAQSVGTLQPYTHYRLTLPNENCRLRLSGNYRVTILDENERPVLIACFMVLERAMALSLSATSLTDADVNGRHQQLSMSLQYGALVVRDAGLQLSVVVMQNGRWDNARLRPKPQMVRATGLDWTHSPDLIFDGGNEYRKFEVTDLDHPTMGVERLTWDGQQYHAYTWTDEPRPNYLYDVDADGAFLIRNADNVDTDVTTDYFWMHFRLQSPQLQGRVYLNGWCTNQQFTPSWEMVWNDSTQLYEGKAWLKQGYYNYQYLWQRPDGTLTFVPSEGNYYQTENQYQALVYYREQGGRTDRLVAYGKLVTR